MARTSQREVLADRQDAAQPPLFDDSALPVCLPVLEAVRAKRYEFKGVRLVEDEAKALRLVELLLARWGVKKISREMHISAHTVRAARRELTRQGKLAPYVQRVVESMEDAIEAGINNYRDALEDGRISPSQIPVGLGIIFDKRQLANGHATSISARMDSGDDSLRVEQINAYLENLPSADPGPAKDSASTGKLPIPQETGREPTVDVTLDVTEAQQGARSGALDMPAVHPTGLEPGAAADRGTGQPGGGGGLGGGAVD